MPKAEQSLNELLHEIRRVEKSREVLTEKKIRKIYQQLLKELNHFLADEYLKYSQNGILTVAILQEKSRYAKFLEEIENNVNFLAPKVIQTIRKTVEDTYTACYKGMSGAVLNAGNTKSALEYLKDLKVRPEVMKRAIENPVSGLTLPDILEKNRKEVIYDIKQQVNISLMNGDRYETAAKKIAERLDVSYGKATNIARTETHRVTEGGFMDCAKEIQKALDDSEFVYAAIWRTMKDERVRPQRRYHTKSGWKTSGFVPSSEIGKNSVNHVIMEGKIIQVGDKFQLEPGVYAECPGMSGTARNDCRCRCFLEYDLLTKTKFLKQGGKLLDKSGESDIIEVGKQRGIDNMNAVEEKHTAAGNRRSLLYKLTDEDIEIVKDEIKEINADADKFVFNSNITRGTCFLASDGKVHIKGNVFPDESSNHPRDKMSIRAVIAHEYYGHRPYREQYLREDSDISPNSINKIMARAWADEFRASYMAAKNAPNLSDEDRHLLIRDSLSRAEEAGVTIKYNDFIRRVLYG